MINGSTCEQAHVLVRTTPELVRSVNHVSALANLDSSAVLLTFWIARQLESADMVMLDAAKLSISVHLIQVTSLTTPASQVWMEFILRDISYALFSAM